MLSKTHLACGIAASLAILHPDTPKGLAVAVIGGALGGSVPDIDLVKNRTNLDSIFTQTTALVIAVAAILADYYYDYGIVRYLSNHPGSAVTGIVLYLVLMVIGFYAPHRGFTHSILALVLFSASIRIVYPQITTAYALGYFSHLALDLLNRKPVQLFFPIRKGFCLHLCYSNRRMNRFLFVLGTALSVCLFFASALTIWQQSGLQLTVPASGW